MDRWPRPCHRCLTGYISNRRAIYAPFKAPARAGNSHAPTRAGCALVADKDATRLCRIEPTLSLNRIAALRLNKQIRPFRPGTRPLALNRRAFAQQAEIADNCGFRAVCDVNKSRSRSAGVLQVGASAQSHKARTSRNQE